MWETRFTDSNDLLFSGKMFQYIMEDKDTGEEHLVCEIKFVDLKNLKSLPQDLSDKYRGVVYSKDKTHIGVSIYDEDLDVVKLKCLVRAKEAGWNIDSIC